MGMNIDSQEEWGDLGIDRCASLLRNEDYREG